MKKFSLFALVTGLLLTVGACKKTDNQPVGYQYAFNDDFNNNGNNWSFNSPSTGAQVAINGGYLDYTYFPSTSNQTSTVAVPTGCDVYNDFDVQTSISSDNEMGLVMDAGGSHYGYSFIIDDQNGAFAVYDEGSSTIQPQPILNWQTSSAIKAAFNNLEIQQSGNRWYGYINGTQVFNIAAEAMYSDHFGFIVLANTNGSADYLTVKW